MTVHKPQSETKGLGAWRPLPHIGTISIVAWFDGLLVGTIAVEQLTAWSPKPRAPSGGGCRGVRAAVSTYAEARSMELR